MDAGRVQHPPHLLPQSGKEEDHPHQGQPGEQGQPPPAGGEVLHALREDDPDGGLFRGQAEAQKGDAGLVEDGVGKLENEPGEELTRDLVGAAGRSAPGDSQFFRGQQIGGVAEGENFAADDPGQGGPVAQGHPRPPPEKTPAEGQGR